MIASSRLHHLLLSLTLCSGAAGAVGFGEITLHSRIGEPLRAEVPVIAGGEAIDPNCFSLAPLPGADFPVITAGRTRLVRIGQDYRLIISGSKAIDEPVVAINLRAGCGLDLQREYVLLPAPPLAPTQTTTGSDIDPPRTTSARQAQRQTQRYTRRYQPPTEETSSDNAWADSENAELPSPQPRVARAPRTAPKPKAPLPRDTLAAVNAGQDKLVLGTAQENLAQPGTPDPLAPVNELNERILKMETTLHLLNEEVDKLNSAVSLGAESRAVREKLQDMQSSQAALAVPVQAEPPPAPPRNSSIQNGWLELLLGLLLGGTVSAGVAHLVSRRQDKARPFDAPPPRIAKPVKPAKSGKQKKPAKA